MIQTGDDPVGKIAALIPAAGYSSRMGLYKPLLPIGDSLVIERPVRAFLAAGIEDIRVITGYKAPLLNAVINRLGVMEVHNPDFDRGMYSSIRAGVAALPEETEAFFLLPADYPLVSWQTVTVLMEEYRRQPRQVIYPLYQGRRGHPPLISATLLPAVLQSEPREGLKGLLQDLASDYAEIPVDDQGIIQDLDHEEDYRRIVASLLPPYPVRTECERILENFKISRSVILHSQEVCSIACFLCEHLNSRGLYLHTAMVAACSLLHDMAKGEKDHAARGKQIAVGLGYPEMGDIIGAHMDLPDQHLDAVNEHAVLYLADKLIQENKIIALEKRLAQQKERFSGDSSALQSVLQRMSKALRVQNNLEAVLGSPLEKLLADGF